MTEEQKAIIYELTRDDARRLVEAGEIGTWKNICKNIQDLGNSGVLLPVNVVQFYTSVVWDFASKRYVATAVQDEQIRSR